LNFAVARDHRERRRGVTHEQPAQQLAEYFAGARSSFELATATGQLTFDQETVAYYPVLGGAVRGSAGRTHLNRRWDEFVVPGVGARCVSDRPWVTVAETCELVLTLDAIGDRPRARDLFDTVQHLRGDDGGFWTGYVWPDDAIWPEERSTWTAAAVVLAADALASSSLGNGLFRGDGLPILIRIGAEDCDAQCTTLTGDLA